MDLQNLFETYIKSGLYLKNWSPKTAVLYRRAFTSFQQSLRKADGFTADTVPGSVEPLLTKAQLEAWIIWMRSAQACGHPNKRNLSPACVNIYIRAINAFCAWLKAEGHTTEEIILKQIKAPLKLVTVFSAADIRLITAFRPKSFPQLTTWTLLQALLDTGCRINEVLSLKVENVDFDSLILAVEGKGGKKRKVPFSLELRKLLWRYKEMVAKRLGGREPTFMFATRTGHGLMYRNAYRDIIRLCVRIGITKHVHPHLTRHSFACHFMKHGGSIYTLSRILGHSSVSTTQTYIRGLGVEDFQQEHARLSPLSRI